MPDGDDLANPDNRDDWEGVDEYTTDVTLPDGSTVTQTSDGKGGPTKNTLRDRDGKIQKTWDADDIPFDESDTSADIFEAPQKALSRRSNGAGTPSRPEFPLFNNPQAEALGGGKRDTDAKEPLLQRYWRRIREGKDPGPDPRTSGDTQFPDDYVIQDGVVSEETVSWFRRGPVMIPILVIAGTLVIVVSVNLFASDDEATQAVSDVSDEPLPGLDDDIEPEPEAAEVTAPSDDGDSTDAAADSADEEADATPEPTPVAAEDEQTTDTAAPLNTVPGATVTRVDSEHGSGTNTITIEVEGDGRALSSATDTTYYNVLLTVETPRGGFKSRASMRAGTLEWEVAGPDTRPIEGATLAADWIDESTYVIAITNPDNDAAATAIQVDVLVGVVDSEGTDVYYQHGDVWAA